MNEHIKTNLMSYTFLSWLIVPVLLTWFGSNYIIGSLGSKPEWQQPTPVVNVQATPYDVIFPAIQNENKGIVTLWFDDAWISQYLVAAPILKEANIPAAIAVPTGTVGYDNFANWAQVRALQHDGWEITNHSVSHDCSMETWSKEKIQKEFTDSTNELWRQKLPSDIFVAPCGVNSSDLIQVTEKNFVSYRGTEPGYNDLSGLDLFDLRVKNITNVTTIDEMKAWINEAKKDKKWLILVFHQIGTEEEGRGEDYSMTTSDFRQLVAYINSSGIQIALPSQVLSLRKTNE